MHGARRALVLYVEKDLDFEFSMEYENRETLDGCFGLCLSGLEAGIYRVRFDLMEEGREFVAINVMINPCSWPMLEEI